MGLDVFVPKVARHSSPLAMHLAGRHTDLAINCDDGAVIHAHRVVLAMCSAVLDTTDSIVFDGASTAVVRLFVEFCYYGATGTPDGRRRMISRNIHPIADEFFTRHQSVELVDLIDLAVKFDVPDWKAFMQRQVIARLDVGNVAIALPMADEHR